jgi:hypothetical protein
VKRRGALIGLAAVVLASLALGLIGLGVEGRLSPLSLGVPGTSAERNASVISPWARGALDALRPDRREALVLVDFHVPLPEAMRHTVPRLERTLEAQVHAPVPAAQSGFASVSRALQEESLGSTQRAELLAALLLVLVLLRVCRSLVAAAIPLAFGFEYCSFKFSRFG